MNEAVPNEQGNHRALRAAQVAFVAGLALCGVALGSIHTEALATATSLLAVAFGLAYLPPSSLTARPKTGATLLLTLAVALVVFTALTTVPLPASIATALAPANADVWERSLRPFHQPGPTSYPISLDPIATRVEVLRGLTYILTFATAHRFTQSRGGTEFLERVVIGAALFMAAASILHPVVGAERVLGLYRPENAYGTHIAPILNANHLAAYLNLGLAVGLGVLASTRSQRERVLVAGSALFLVGMEFFAASRGGLTTTFLSGAIVAVLYLRLRKGQSAGVKAAPLLLGLAAVVGIGLLVVAGYEQARLELGSRDTSKLDQIRQALTMVRPHGVFGVGRGAFESTFPAYRTGGGYVTVTHPENVIAQLVVEWGIPCTAIALGVMGFALHPRAVLSRSKPPLGAYAALVGLAVHNLVDFSSELPGVMVLAVTCAAIVTGSVSDAKTPRPFWARHTRAFAGVTLGATALALFVTLRDARNELYPERVTVGRLATDKATPRKDFDAAIRAALLRHPAEPYIPYVAAVRGQIFRDGPVIQWAGHALERSPVYGPVHLVLARALARSVPSQARVEYRLALEQQGGGESWEVEALRLVHDYDEAMELVPEGPYRPHALELLAAGLESRLPATRLQLDQHALKLDAKALGPLKRSAQDALLDAQENAVWCKGRECVERGIELASRLREQTPSQCEGHALSAELRAAAGSPEIAVRELEAASDRVTDRTTCLVRLVGLMESTGLTAEIDATIERVANAGCVTPTDCAENFAFAGALYVGRGSPRRAIAFYRKAIDRTPERDEYLLEYARLASTLELHAETLHAYTLLAELHPEVPEYMKLVEQERAAVARTRFGPTLRLPTPAP